MMDLEGDVEHHSFDNIRASEVYPKKSLEADDPSLLPPYPTLCGEGIENIGRTADGVITISNFRLYVHSKEAVWSIPLGLIDQVDCRDIFYLHILTKDGCSYRCTFITGDDCQKWYHRLLAVIGPPEKVEQLFCFAFFAWCKEERKDDLLHLLQYNTRQKKGESWDIWKESQRMGFNMSNIWRITTVNKDYEFCSSYPRFLLVPALVTDKDLQAVAKFRYSHRIPTVVWRHQGNGAVIARSSQPAVGLFAWRCNQDEDLIEAIAAACSSDVPCSEPQVNGVVHEISSSLEKESDLSIVPNINNRNPGKSSRKLLVLDARSYTAAMANRAKGGGLEFPEYYSNCEIVYMGLANIHCIRKSFQAVRSLCSTPPELQKWLTQLESTGWLHNISSLLKAALVVVNMVHKEARPVLVHCSDGWDRTPQIVALAEIMLDPFYRTMEGFQVLVEREWLDFGHKFADRCGHGPNATDQNERCPVFLQWLDCVFQLLQQFPCSFEFNQQYLVKLGRHTYSCLFGTFLCNSSKERGQGRINERTFSVWSFLNYSPQFYNYLYTENEQVLFPSCHIRSMVFWSEMYTPSTVTPASGDVATMVDGSEANPPATEADKKATQPLLMRTKSCDDIYGAHEEQHAPGMRRQLQHAPCGMRRQSSDPSLCDAMDSILSVDGNNTTNQQMTPSPPPPQTTTTNSNDPLVLQQQQHPPTMNSSLHIEEEGPLMNGGEVLVNGVQTGKPEASIDGSTETLVSEKGLDLDSNRPNGDSRCCNGEVCARGDCPCEARTLLHVESRGATTSVSTSTTDISDSSVNPCQDANPAAMHTCLSEHNWGLLLGDVLGLANGNATSAATHQHKSTSVGCSLRSTPLHSRTPSSGFPATPNDDRLSESGYARLMGTSHRLDIDGLMVIQDKVQQRLQQIFETHQAEVEELRRDLCMAKLALCQQVYQSCNGTDRKHLENTINSAAEESNGGEKQPSSQESSAVSSDVSWEHVDNGGSVLTTLWVPDHAVSRCTGCDAEFWLGRRKHHCRNCGQIFCAQCSSQMVPVPNEHLFQPVRVCITCYETLSSHCKQSSGGPQDKVMKPVVATAST